jgi:ssRNA-specific RNase YbeY (16S rRNA maturation enzyme)
MDSFLPMQLLLGDVIISLDTAKRQALERGHSVLDELRILLVWFISRY